MRFIKFNLLNLQLTVLEQKKPLTFCVNGLKEIRGVYLVILPGLVILKGQFDSGTLHFLQVKLKGTRDPEFSPLSDTEAFFTCLPDSRLHCNYTL